MPREAPRETARITFAHVDDFDESEFPEVPSTLEEVGNCLCHLCDAPLRGHLAYVAYVVEVTPIGGICTDCAAKYELIDSGDVDEEGLGAALYTLLKQTPQRFHAPQYWPHGSAFIAEALGVDGFGITFVYVESKWIKDESNEGWTEANRAVPQVIFSHERRPLNGWPKRHTDTRSTCDGCQKSFENDNAIAVEVWGECVAKAYDYCDVGVWHYCARCVAFRGLEELDARAAKACGWFDYAAGNWDATDIEA